ncbi:hypothetical protein [Dysgonomonas sp. 511]|uniref:hypothetical protein n=1 Tax=Dysgonomonas sp. 511 TaxID=2302930 RepID=UPI0013D2C8C1|nr:hypothetical protein [Dysgonomonas sp. 511]NDV77845.1 hypothetical protein [Dysgonomonas sp. 511]
MAAKRYISKTGVKYTFLVSVNGKIKSVSFKGNEKDCIIQDAATQKAVEDSEYFKDGRIGVAPGTTAGGFDEDVSGLAGTEKTEDKLNVARSDSRTNAQKEADALKAATEEESAGSGTEKTEEGKAEEKVHTGVTSPLDARDILIETYGVSPQGVQKNPEAILKKATELGVSFPDLKIE